MSRLGGADALAAERFASGCTRIARDVDEDLVGNAPHASGWVIIEQPGPYGRDALFESRLPTDIARGVADSLADSGVKVLLGRRTVLHERGTLRSTPASAAPGGRSVEGPGSGNWSVPSTERAVWWTWGERQPTLYRLAFTDPEQLRDLDWAALRDGRPEQVHPAQEICRDPLLLLCTNGRRDVCCAALARPVATRLAADERYRHSFLESSHLGGHRFAPGALQLPHGWSHGRLDADSAAAVLDDARAGRIHLESARGPCALSAPGQVAEIAVRRQTRCDTFGAVVVTEAEDPAPAGISTWADATKWAVSVAGAGTWRAVVTAETGPLRPESCGAAPVAMMRYQAKIERVD